MTENDNNLIEEFRAGNQDCFNLLVKRYTALIGKISNDFFVRGADRDDVFQEGLIGFFQAVRDYDLKGNFSTFAYLCTRRRIIEAVVTANRNKHGPLNNYTKLPDKKFSQDRLIEDCIIQEEEENQLQKYLAEKLSKLEFDVFLLYADGCRPAEIAQKLGCHIKIVDNALTRAKRKLGK